MSATLIVEKTAAELQPGDQIVPWSRYGWTGEDGAIVRVETSILEGWIRLFNERSGDIPVAMPAYLPVRVHPGAAREGGGDQ